MVLRTGTGKNSSGCDPAASGICVWPQHLGSRGASREKWGLIMRHGILRVGGRLWVRLRTVAESECFKFKTCWIQHSGETNYKIPETPESEQATCLCGARKEPVRQSPLSGRKYGLGRQAADWQKGEWSSFRPSAFYL